MPFFINRLWKGSWKLLFCIIMVGCRFKMSVSIHLRPWSQPEKVWEWCMMQGLRPKRGPFVKTGLWQNWSVEVNPLPIVAFMYFCIIAWTRGHGQAVLHQKQTFSNFSAWITYTSNKSFAFPEYIICLVLSYCKDGAYLVTFGLCTYSWHDHHLRILKLHNIIDAI